MDVPALAITFDQRVDDYRHMVFQTFLPADCTQGALNGALDKVRIAAERQKAIAHLPTLKGLLADREAALKEEIETHFSIETERDFRNSNRPTSDRRNPKQSSAELAEDARYTQGLANSQAKIKQIKKQIEVDKRQIEDALKLLADGE